MNVPEQNVINNCLNWELKKNKFPLVVTDYLKKFYAEPLLSTVPWKLVPHKRIRFSYY